MTDRPDDTVITDAIDRLATPGVRRIHPYETGKPIEEVQRELGLTDVVKLASNESPLGVSPRAHAAMRGAIDDLERYPDGNGYYLKQALSDHLSVAPERITLGNGSNDVLDLVARCFVSADDEVVFSEHAFVVFMLATLSVSAKPVVVPARAWGHDLDAMSDAITDATRLVFIANPNNPTGTWNESGALRDFMGRVPDNVLVVVDQAYAEYIVRPDYPDCVQWLDAYPNLIVTRTFSKVHGLAGVRVGYAVSHPRIANYLNRVRHPFNVNSLGLIGAQAALGDQDHVEKSRELNDRGLAQLATAFEGLGLEYVPSIGNFISVDVGESDNQVFDALLRRGVIVRPIAGYGMPRHVRISVGLGEENARCVEALTAVIDERGRR